MVVRLACIRLSFGKADAPLQPRASFALRQCNSRMRTGADQCATAAYLLGVAEGTQVAVVAHQVVHTQQLILHTSTQSADRSLSEQQ